MKILAIKGQLPENFFDGMFPKVSNRFLHNLLEKEGINLESTLYVHGVDGGIKISTLLDIVYSSDELSSITEVKVLEGKKSLREEMEEVAQITVNTFFLSLVV